LLGRINYAFEDKYLSANIRRDGSSVFSSLHKYAIFPSFSAGWRISGERFMSNLPRIADVKLRGSWGQVGIDGNLGNGTEYATIASGYPLQFRPHRCAAMAGNRVPNSDLKWETVTQSDIGIDMGLCEIAFKLTVDYFSKRYRDMITPTAYPYLRRIVSDAFTRIQSPQPVNSATVTNRVLSSPMNYQKSAGSFTL